MIIVITTAITYTTFSMNQVTQLAETIGIKQTTDLQRSTEEFQVIRVQADNNKFNMTVQNTGEIPVHLNRLWIENTTDSNWPIAKYDLDISIPPGGTVKDIGQSLNLASLDSQSYQVQLISDRGNSEQIVLNSVGDSSIFLRLTATPAVMPTTFQTTVSLEIINTGTSKLVNLKPTMSTDLPVCNVCVLSQIGTVQPASFDSLSPGDTAIFEWIYSFSGQNGDRVDFTAGILNDLRTDTFSVSLQTIESSLNADVAVESGGLGDQQLLGDDVLIFHEETTNTVGGPAYQMYSGSAEGGSNGDRIELELETPHFFTNNGSQQISIPSGAWNIAMQLQSEHVHENIGKDYSQIFHFEDGVLGNPFNSLNDSNLNLIGCGNTEFSINIVTGTDDAEERYSDGEVWTNEGGDLELAKAGSDDMMIGLRYQNVALERNAIINNAYLSFYPDEYDSGTTYLRIYGELHDNPPTFVNSANYNISSRIYTTASVNWDITNSWTKNVRSSATESPDISSIIQEIVNQDQWDSGDSIVIIVENDNIGNNVDREGKPYEDSTTNNTILSINYGGTGHPDYVQGSGPHNSGSFHFDGSTQCFESEFLTSDSNNNDIGRYDSSTAMWFKTDGAITGSTDQYLVDWSAPGETCPNCEFYRIYLTGGAGSAGGKVTFEFSPNSDGNAIKCQTTSDYDDGSWYHVAAYKFSGSGGGNPETCDLQVTGLDGVVRETDSNSINLNGQYVDVADIRYHIGSNVAENNNFFQGYIDDFMHFDDDKLTYTEMTLLARTNYGIGAHRFDVTLDVTDTDGNFLRNLYDSLTTPLETAFADPRCADPHGASCRDLDSSYTQVNMTMGIGTETVLAPNERLDLYFAWNDGSTDPNWEPLEVDMKIDDTTMNNPYPSFMQIPYPDNPFPTYYVYDTDDDFRIYVANTGNDGIFFTYQGTRVNFDGTGGSYASLIYGINGTSNPYLLNEDRDSLYIPAGELAELFFYDHPTNIPSINSDGTEIPSGPYSTTVWANGYSDQGETFTRSIVIGSVTVIND